MGAKGESEGGTAGSVQIEQSPTALRLQLPAMGTVFTIVVWAPEDSEREASVQRAFARVTALEKILTDYDARSEARQVTQHAHEWVPISDLLAEALRKGQQLHQETDGRVDPTAGTLTRLWRRAVRQQELPGPEVLNAALACVGMDKLVVAPGRLRCKQSGMRLDFGAFGKGLAIDHAFESLWREGFRSILVEGGGDLRVGMPPPHQPAGWMIQIETMPGHRATVTLQNRALASSGNRFQSILLNGRDFGHIIDLSTGLGTDGSLGASVVAATACQADGWATALCIWGKPGLAHLPPGLQARIVKRHGSGPTASYEIYQHPAGAGIGARGALDEGSGAH